MNRAFEIASVMIALSVAAGAQQQPPPLQANAPLVLVAATVTDRKGNLIDGLTADDFVVADDGVRQDIRLDTSDTVLAPVSLVVAVQWNFGGRPGQDQSRGRNDPAAGGRRSRPRGGHRLR